jgi:TM2 domain-containing membrane protein YozV
MTQPPGWDDPSDQPGDEPPTRPYQYGPQPPYSGPYPQPYPPSAYGFGHPPPGYDPRAPYGVHGPSGIPYSDKSKIVAGLLQVLLPLGIGRMYMGHTGIGVAQLLVTIFTCGVGALWPFVDGILILVSDSKDADGRMLRS